MGARTRVADGPRQVYFRPKIGSKFSPDPVNASQAIITNPYMDPARLFFAKPLALQCTADGGLIVGGRVAGRDSVPARRASGAQARSERSGEHLGILNP